MSRHIQLRVASSPPSPDVIQINAGDTAAFSTLGSVLEFGVPTTVSRFKAGIAAWEHDPKMGPLLEAARKRQAAQHAAGRQDMAAVRMRKGLSQRQLAAMVGVAELTISRWEAGQNEPRLSDLRSLSKALGITVEELMQAHDATIARSALVKSKSRSLVQG